ncbi:MAG: sigma-70 family RNA polymerase sigma factor [Pirellulales bacterium]|nr:sigma-70 family RNA polymerase sigma factor [Pirellulales bacterium]
MPDDSRTTEYVRLWTLHGKSIYAYLMTLASNAADADEIYQDVGMTLWEKFDQYAPGTSFQAWARQIALNKVRNFRRLHRHKTVLCSPELLDVLDQRIAAETETLHAQQKAFVDCLEKLPARHKELLERRYRPGATAGSVAREIGRKVNAVHQALSRIHNALFDCVRKATLPESAS